MTLPLSTYRLQLHAGFGFDAVAEVAAYLHDLGVSHIYSSPYLQANPGSMHGYDVIDHRQPNEELGGFAGHERMCRVLGENNLGQILDIVPNHMSIASRRNRWWWDVLENGQASRYASYFDVDWQAPEERLRNVVSLPILGDHFGRVLERKEIRLVRDGGTFTFEYFDHALPTAPRSLNDVLMNAAQRAGSDELAFLADAHANLPLSTETDFASATKRHRDKEVLRRLLARLCQEQPNLARAIDETILELNNDPAAMRLLLDRQNYRLSFWRTAGQELAYRRFFDINTLASLRMEDEHVFEDTHALVLEWVDRGVIDGLRIDHPDGLLDPSGYFRRLRERCPKGWIVVEKILEPGEWLPTNWPVHGTTGYDFLNRLGGVLVDPDAEAPLTRIYEDFTGQTESYEEVVYAKKQLVLRESFAADLHRLTSLLVQVCERHPRYRDYTRRELLVVLREIIACFPVYRTYTRARSGEISETDVQYINQAVDKAQTHRPEVETDLYQFVRDILLLRFPGDIENEFVMRFQQVTGPVMAKGVEDTAFYNYNRLLALNEVGGDPGKFGLSLEQFHWNCLEILKTWPRTMLTTTTHDTKRSEDVRARLALLSEIPDEWAAAVERWAKTNERHKQNEWPDRNFEYALYQTLFGAWPISGERAVEYARKAMREAKAFTSWTQPRPEYEDAVTAFVDAILADEALTRDLEAFLEPLKVPGWINSLTQALVKLTAPGVPDVYQGSELWDYSLVDPDNRRPVDFEQRQNLLAELDTLTPEQVLERFEEGLPKLWLTRQALHLRRERPDVFGPEGAYSPVWASGTHSHRVLAFDRGGQCLVVAPLRPLKTAGRWEDTALELALGRWRNQLTGDELTGGERVPIGELLSRFPVALFVRTA